MGLSLIAFDTDHIKQFVFGTSKLKEIRGASSLLDYLNRRTMLELASSEKYKAVCIYANGGAGQFYIESDKAEAFIRGLQAEYRKLTGGAASLSYAIHALPEGVNRANIEDTVLKAEFELLDWKLQENKQHPPSVLALPSLPFMRHCSSCGVEYACADEILEDVISSKSRDEEDEENNEEEANGVYCESCLRKRGQDRNVKRIISKILPEADISTSSEEFKRRVEGVVTTNEKKKGVGEALWMRVLPGLHNQDYKFDVNIERPADFNEFANFKGAKQYLALVYADANNMGQAFAKCKTIPEKRKLAQAVDEAILQALCVAINEHLQIERHLKPEEQLTEEARKHPIFPFDILLLGGDDMLIAVPASAALDVALSVTKKFHELMSNHTLSVGVVLAPIRYPFGLLLDMVESTLKFAKKAGSEARAQARTEGKEDKIDDSRINFMVVTGSNSNDFEAIYDETYYKRYKDYRKEKFYATLRPYKPEDLGLLLDMIRESDKKRLGRTKLHQLREAVLKMNLTSSVYGGLALLNHWRYEQRTYVAEQVYGFANRYRLRDPENPLHGYPRVVFPWFRDTSASDKDWDVYRTSLLDFVELYDFVTREAESSIDEN
ncbi:hypothetical protein EPA93_22855 [Ktedonosporobacter rubrisoli]|uniref:GGDEF domain-containing protein n=1 Tax=Ktedonosporobacter rubrisoli TaxID=2509675 RepID=A0A4V0YZ68_KTERU|nr:hypothetical protein [Ktedonosporobacter rubrisoli]QBD78671.1 hypothetical protein EPA93_22855 [Ktedonosporobacter rubrisoli]